MTVPALPVPHDGKCGKRKKQGPGLCGQTAGWGTDHPGVGPCKLHGGATPSKHGRYSTLKRASLRELIKQHEADPDPLNIFPELAAARALFQDFIERYDTWREALLGWWQSWAARGRQLDEQKLIALEAILDDFEDVVKGEAGELTERQEEQLEDGRALLAALRMPPDDGRPREVLDLADAYRIVSEVTKIAERIEKIRAANAISQPELFRLMGEMGRVVETHVRDDAIKERIRLDWLRICRLA